MILARLNQKIELKLTSSAVFLLNRTNIPLYRSIHSPTANLASKQTKPFTLFVNKHKENTELETYKPAENHTRGLGGSKKMNKEQAFGRFGMNGEEGKVEMGHWPRERGRGRIRENKQRGRESERKGMES